MSRAQIVTDPIDIAAITREVSDAAHGAIATFLGAVREHSGDRSVTGLEYSVYPEMAAVELSTILAEAVALAPRAAIVAVHRVGKLAVGDVCVMIAVGDAHRAPAFEACRYMIEEIKKRVPIWKKEQFADGSSTWVNSDAAAASGAGARR